MTTIHARTGAEAREYMVLALPECDGDVTVERTDVSITGGQIVQSYVAGCAERGIRRDFAFTTDPVPDDADSLQFGYGSQPSTLIDAGQWYLIFARYAEVGRAIEDRFAPNPPDLESAEQVYEWYARSREALVEVLKFVPPDGDEVPGSAFWTEAGQAVRQRYGSQLRRPVLTEAIGQVERALRAYRDAYA